MTIDNKAQLDNLEMELMGELVPEKFRGKPVKDVLKSYSELESAYSRQGKELGDVRRFATTLTELEARTSKNAEPQRTPVDAEALLADPDKAINEAIESHPTVQRARETVDTLERQLALTDFERRHPTFRQDATDPQFKEWVDSKPGLQKLARSADAYDLDAADTLFSLWSERQELAETSKAKQEATENRKKKEQAGTLEGSSGAEGGSDVVFNRAEIRELHKQALLGNRTAKAKWEDPKFKAELRRAYADKRVS